ncbi:MAG: glycerol-3-phosphate 1-O-acyltransferase PlsY [Bacteroidales bacterium]|nr:glycerol-3-phosphate 1-O-acyltransferase PlsY [Bacteroidales bacterium]
MMMISISILLAYLLGSIPSSVWMGKWFRGIDLREYGSGNAGATNAFRVLGKPIGVVVLLLDMLKGFLAVNLSHLQEDISPGSEGWMILRIVLGALAVAGHIFPVFAGFRGGKGVATIAGIGLALHPFAALAAMGVYVLVFLVFKLSALGSLTAVLSYPVWVILVFQAEYKAIWVFSIAVPLLTIITHRTNIRRLIRGKEKPVLKN